MPVQTRRRSIRASAAVAAALSLGALTACSSTENDASETTEEITSSTTAATTTEETSSEPASSEESSTEETAEKSSTRTSAPKQLDEGVVDAKKIFASLAPDTLWEQFDQCNETGVEGNWACSGSEIGQFQFFDSNSKASSTTQVLTELRSSEIVEDTGRYVVGWSTLGSTAVITVVDNDKGMVLQHMVSSDSIEPEKHIKELGLDKIAQRDKQESEPSHANAS